ncbi:sushi, von Willebrand factor type A, EGF and pentraxin domain-containing protein 1-like [Biomphalaria glabrata]|uniref:Sushi, von Willebrand factor type A, EGF and pentraxin domain-containing protein 1-like n=1 Tax=Biomphalaria glabrata TaxID=6526 RepID=A0A9W3AG36_BIOGL|nr:sushi, von Willebrand factor type A, EGF and pentraxin domain-containing protein 1-like [Biomphalaria glabrata]XP_055886164.1 sushi, von Willebrand factor type A, EGF and pentraxin domain-containing protein 1-like [Biomphalaria glabrata]XP_055886165.1 sushi, von Willebrand factor type A, EGF and pentraxin domain-containing protein 1-like [Biomphalaria glabrata]
MRAPHFALFLLWYLVILLQPTDSRVLFRRPGAYNTFMKQVTVNFEKAKVETLGDIFKRHVQQLRHTPNKMVELVFLIDSSGTVGRSYFYEEVRFVRYLLSDFTVDVNTTRVSVITFSSPNKIFRYIDYLSYPDQENHKCRLLTEDIPQVDYTPGGTHTLGAFLEAEKVLKSARPDAVKAIFLMTDGYSNGGDPRPVAKKLKRDGVKIFTFGIRDGFVWELQEMASEPKNETCYILDSFEEFEALAKRALHADLQTGSYVEQSADKCRRLCNSENLCCHENASCSCGTYTGKYECLCRPGYFGTGRGRNGCKPCPPGTYKNFTGLGDINICIPCPDEHQTTPEGAVSIAQCVCKRGYRSFGHRSCTVFRCPELSPPKNGYFVNNKCNNVFNAACGLRCQHGYELRGSSLRICQDDGTWSGQPAECIMKTCPSLPSPKNGHMICSSDDFSYSTVCRFTCNAGYQLVGSRKRTCLAIAYWTGIATICREITCPPLVEIKDGLITPQSCMLREVVFGTTCHMSCLSDYTLKGPHNKQCTPDGTWLATGTGVNQCIDETPPVLQCPENIEIEADEVESTTEVSWSAPVPVDNSGFRPVLTADPPITSGSRLPIGVTVITYKAEDLSQNVATCKFTISVVDKTPPRVDKCQSPSPFISSQDTTEILLETPLFSDNSGLPVEVVSSFKRGKLFPSGTTKITYTAFDNANNNSSCSIEVTVIRHRCGSPVPPVHGNITCKDGEIGVLCHIVCDVGYAFAVAPAEEYFCAYEDGRWLPQENFPFPDCAETQISNEIEQPATITLTGDLSCKDKILIDKIQQDLEGKMEDKILIACENDVSCSVASLKAVCEDEEDFNRIQLIPDKSRSKRLIKTSGKQSRLKRHVAKKSRLSFEIVLEGSVKNNEMRTASSNKSELLMNMLTMLQNEASKGSLDLLVDDHILKLSQFSYDLDLLTIKCPDGSIVVNETCVKCPVGTYYANENKTCRGCPVGSYQHEEGHISCLTCPANKATEKEQSKSEQECKAFCPPGSFSMSGLEPCETCHLGFYQQNYSSTSCVPCPKGQITLRRGSKTDQDCAVLCKPGFIGNDGLAPCIPCPVNTYQPKSGQTECIYCPPESGTAYNGSTSIMDCLQSDIINIQGDQQFIFPFGCSDEPCENGGTCVFRKGIPNFKCHCLADFTGTNCETRINYCASLPCGHAGLCVPKTGGYTCNCKAGFTGFQCEIDINECASQPCLNKGICIDGINQFTCNCPLPFTGPTCASAISNCAEINCLNGGVCINTQSSFKCNCPPGFSGITCEIDIDECQATPCKNDGTCQDLPNDYKCLCMPGFTGKSCETQINECADLPCQNGATCEDLINNYRCHCTVGFTGHKCEKVLTSQYQLDFISPSIMDYAELAIDQPMTSVTASFWIKSNDESHGGTPFSYAAKDNFNAFTVTRLEGLTLSINNEQRIMNTKVNDGAWHHVVFTWSYNRGNWKLFVDGILKDEGFDLSTQKPIPGKGIFIVGQEQDSFGGDFSPSETLNGTLSHLNVWDQEFTSKDVENLRSNCNISEGNIISWSAVQASLKGNVVASTPSVFCQDCPLPTSPLNGRVSYTDTKVGSQINFECNTGYALGGPPTLTCLISREYDNSNRFPECEVINCGSPRSVRNGKIKGRDFTYGKKVSIECNFGYVNKGLAEISCDEFGDWSRGGTCEFKTCTLPVDMKNTIKSVNKTSFFPKDVVRFTCKPGHYLQTQHDSVTCELGGSWDKSVPSCDSITCSKPPNIANGKLVGTKNDYNIGDEARYKCDTGFEFSQVGDNTKDTLACLPSGQWETLLPQCLPITCPDPPPVRNAIAVGEGRTYLSPVTYSCLPGFLPSGKNIIECEANKDWSAGSKFSCSPVKCGEPPPFQNGAIEGNDYYFNNIISYQCHPGYILNGEDNRKCQENATWSGEDPSCNAVSCGDLSPIANGNVNYKDVTYQSTAKYTCHPGFELKGSEEIVCEATSSWQPDPPTCDPRPCPVPQDITFGTYAVTGPLIYKANLTYMCNTGYQLNGTSTLSCQEDGSWSAPAPICLPIQCPILTDITNGFVRLQGTNYSSTATYSCHTGFRLIGTSSRLCQSSGTWSDQAPVCQSTTCSRPDVINNGHLEYKDLSIGSIIRYYCNTGYKLEGDQIRRCLDNVTFSGLPPECKPVQCAPPGTIANGATTLSEPENIYNSTATFTCDNGYFIRGTATIKCESNGQWSSALPACFPVACNVTPLLDGKTNSTTAVYGSVVAYECNPGFKMVGDSVRKCLADGTWDTPKPLCEVIRCPVLSLSGGLVSTIERTVGTVVRLECRGNYHLTGPSVRTCESNGKWSGDEPSCSPITCPPATPIAHGELDILNETTVEYKCNKGYTLLGSNLVKCGVDGIWRPASPICQINTCDDLSQTLFPHGSISYTANKYGDSVTYSCDTGYTLRGDAERLCDETGQWTADEPECKIVDCGHPPLLANGYFEGDEYTFDSVLKIVCQNDYKLKGVETIKCLSNGLWENYISTCELIKCPELFFSNGSVSVDTQNVKGVAKYQCNEGYDLVGNTERTCSDTGEWSGTVPVCNEVVCPEPDPIDQAILEGDKRNYGAKIFYTCKEGYQLYGDFERVCEHGSKWSGIEPVCDPVLCPEPYEFPPHLQFNADQSNYLSVMTLYCDEGYQLVGSPDRVCQSNGTWSGSVPHCIKISCGEPPAIHHAIIVQKSDNLFEAVVKYSCVEGYSSSGLDTTTCLFNKTWSFIDFACNIISCPIILPTDVPNSNLEASTFTFGSTVSFSCIEGFNMSGASNVTCTSLGKWSSTLPECLILQCPSLGQLDFGWIDISSLDYGSIALFSCQIGYNLVGYNETQCLSSATWSVPKPLCQIVSCGALPGIIPNGQLLQPQAEYFFQQMGSYSCEFGYKLSGNSVLTCQETGLFDFLIPSCLRIPCPAPVGIDFGHFTEYISNFTVVYECMSGYNLIGQSELICLLGGNWSDLAPSCLPVICPTPAGLQNGEITGTEFFFGQSVQFSCYKGYNLIGSPQLECLANESWSDAQPHCAPVDCGEPTEQFNHGFIKGTYTYGGSIEYHCNPGFQLNGKNLRFCQADGSWETFISECLRLSCQTPLSIDNGFIIGDTYQFEDNITYLCNAGYQLNGDSNHTCLSNLSWSGQIPACLKISCGVPPILLNGKILGNSYFFQDVITISCDFGYRLVGAAVMTCEANGQWSGQAHCEQIVCKEVPAIVNGNYKLDTNSSVNAVLSKVIYECDRGYILNGSHEKICQESGEWSDDLVNCYPVSCSAIQSLQYGTVIGSIFTYLSFVNFTCNPGFDLIGTFSLQCNYTGEWSGQFPYCKVKSCPDVSVAHGIVYLNSNDSSTVTTNRNGSLYIYGDTITIECHAGYEILGNLTSSECRIDGSWSSLNITCTPVQCTEPVGIEHAVLSVPSLTYQSVITVSCVAGYDLIGDDELTCGANKNWVEPLPKCVLLACGSPPSVSNAIIEGDSFKLGDFISYKCKPGYEMVGDSRIQCGSGRAWVGNLPVCREVNCGPPPAFPQATVSVADTIYRSQANLTCDLGYVLQGNSEMICSADQSWKYDPNLMCAPINCGKPPQIDHGTYSADTTILGSLALYMCNPGYFLEDSSSLYCSEDGSWTQDLPQCLPVDCHYPPSIPYTTSEFNGTHYSEKVKYTCNVGYQQSDVNIQAELTCNESGAWQGDIPVCEAINCGLPPDFSHSYYFLDNNRTDYLSLAVYHCNPGYNSSKLDHYLICNVSSLWEGNPIVCTPLDCKDLPILSNGEYDAANGTTFGSVVSYECSRGYTKLGPEFITCTEDGTWSTDYHACLPVNCLQPPDIENGMVELNDTTLGSQAFYSCLPGYTVVGNDTLDCSDTGQWAFANTYCEPVDCQAPISILHGHVNYTSSKFQGLAIYSCDPGYSIGLDTTLVCSESATWVGLEPHCSIINCSQPLVKPYSRVLYSNLSYLSSATFSCEAGYQLVGQSSILCLETGQWSEESPDCSPLDCSHPVEIPHGSLIASGTTFGSYVTYSCHSGYQLKGDRVIYCSQQGTWDGSIPSCDIKDCRMPLDIANGQVIYFSTTFASLATYTCNKGFRLQGNNTIYCDENGHWISSDPAICEEIQCPEPSFIQNGHVSYTQLTVGSLANYACNSGYVLIGSTSRVCNEDGTWQGGKPACDRIKCPVPPQIPHGLFSSSDQSVGIRVNYTCTAGFVHSGVTSIFCQADGTWSSELPMCIPVTCPEPKAILNALITAHTGNNLGSSVTYSCVKGFEMVGHADNEYTVVCSGSGEWSSSMPRCTVVTCKTPPPSIPFSTIKTLGNTYTSETVYTCLSGYHLNGSGKIACNHLGQWSADEPTSCVPMLCGPPPEIPQSTYEGSIFSFNHSVTYRCNPGYDLIGIPTSYCDADGAWSSIGFHCQQQQCTEILAIPDNGEIVGDSDGPFVVGSTVSFVCLNGYSLVGQSTLRCTDSGQWSSQPPLCQNTIDFCKETLTMDNTKPPPPGKLIGSQTVLECVPGYVANGDLTSVCQSDGSWTLPTGRCERAFCGKPVVENALNVKLIGQNYYYGDTVVFICRYGLMPVNGNSVLKCKEDGKWDGEAKCIEFCKQDCLNGGRCIGGNKCKCLPGWAGHRCQTAICIFPCLHGGKCIAPYLCQCKPGYEGSRCEKVLCSKQCQNNGRCVEPDKCQCPFGFTGASCETAIIRRNANRSG